MKELFVLALAWAACHEQPLEQVGWNVVFTLPSNDDLRLVRGYRATDDICQITGETALAVEFLDDAADLVSGSTDSKNREVFGLYLAPQITRDSTLQPLEPTKIFPKLNLRPRPSRAAKRAQDDMGAWKRRTKWT